MDPDGLSILIFTLGGALALGFLWCAGRVCFDDDEKDQQTCLGFSNRAAGLFVCAVLSGGAFVYGLLRLGLAVGWVALAFAGLCAALVLAFSLGSTKSVADPEGFALFRPIGALFSAPAQLLFRALHLTAQADVTAEDLLDLVDDVEEQELIDESQKEMIANIVELDEVTAGEIMTHRTELVSLDASTPAADAVRLAAKEGVSRIPIYRKSIDDVVGILYVKDLFTVWDDPAKSSLPVRKFMRTAMFVPEACRARELLVEFRVKHTQIAVVVDEYGGTSGVVTMEDVLEEIVGNIQDEFDNEDEEIVRQDDGALVVTGSADLEDVFEELELPLPEQDEEEDDFDTVGGLIIDRLGRIPETGEEIAVPYGGILFTVMKVGERRVEKVRCTVQSEAQPENDSAKKRGGVDEA